MIRAGIGCAATAALAAGVCMVNLERQNPDKIPSNGCEAILPNGEKVIRASYPLGSIAVQYQEDRLLFNEVESVEGEIAKDGDEYLLHVPGLPDNLANSYTDFRDTAALVAVDLPKLGFVGLTGACIDAKSRSVYLPTSGN